jgi:hypothetical protein
MLGKMRGLSKNTTQKCGRGRGSTVTHRINIENAENAGGMPERGFDSCVKQSGSNPLLARCIIIPV